MQKKLFKTHKSFPSLLCLSCVKVESFYEQYTLIIKNQLLMTKNYQNELLGLSRTEIQKVWVNLWDDILRLDPVKDYQQLVELNKRFDKCVEAYYAVDCGDHWVVNSASRVKGYSTYKVMKES